MIATAKASFGSKTDMSSFRPIEDQYQIRVVDALRGLALLGILVANIPIANNADEVYAGSRMFLGTSGSDKWLEMLFHFFIDKKFITIFSMLFGFGFYIQLKRAEEQHVAFRSYYFKRMLILLLIGCLHAYLIWFGDITRDYAICGIFLLMVYHWPVKALTNYMLQTVFYLVVFFHWFPGGLHLYGKLSLTETYLLSLLLFAIQVVISHLWLNKFMQGPVEYLWKKLAYAGTK